MMRVLVVNSQVPFTSGGAEIHAECLNRELISRGYESEIVRIPFKWYPAKNIKKHIQSCWNFDLTESCGRKIDAIICLKFPSYCIPHPNKILWLCHQHRAAYDLWESGLTDIKKDDEGKAVKEFIEMADNIAFKQARQIFTNSKNTSKRLLKFNNVISKPLYPLSYITTSEIEKDIKYDEFILVPSRINKLKRQLLILKAYIESKVSLNLVFVGKVEDKEYFNEMNKLIVENNLQKKISFLDYINDDNLIELYSNCRFVMFCPYDEDFGYITIESMKFKKAVLTTTDSGGPLELLNNTNSIICDPQIKSISNGILRLTQNKNYKLLGTRSFKDYEGLNLNWDNIISNLLTT